VPNRALTPDELTPLLERFRPERARGKTPSEISDAEVQLLLARIAALTDALHDAEPNETARLASRILLSDLAVLAAQFRGRANAMRTSLAKALEELRHQPTGKQ
jgi:hypothetical protein